MFGDFDTDGIAGTAVLELALRELVADVVLCLPNRVHEGHGLNSKVIKSLKAQGIMLLVTVDCGVTSVEEVSLASSLGVDTIIIDYHSLSLSIPAATAIINPRVSRLDISLR